MAIQILWIIQKSNIFATRKNGLVAEWLGRGLQNLVQRFESARDLQMKNAPNQERFFILSFSEKLLESTLLFLTIGISIMVTVTIISVSKCAQGNIVGNDRYLLNPFLSEIIERLLNQANAASAVAHHK